MDTTPEITPPTNGNTKAAAPETIADLRARLAGVFARLLSVTGAAREFQKRQDFLTPQAANLERQAINVNMADANREALLALLEGQSATLGILESLTGRPDA